MRAYMVEHPEGEFRAVDRPRPTPAAGQVLVRVHASGINPIDTKIRAGKAAHAQHPLPAVLGLDMAGVIEELGPEVTAFRKGDPVYGMVGGIGGHQGTLAQFVIADSRLLARKPESLSMRETAALPLVTITAWEGLVDRAHVHAGQKVLVHAGAGGVGYIAIQIVKALGAEVFATVSAGKRHYVEAVGATAIDYHSVSTEQSVEQYTAGEGFDVVYDTVGGATLDESFTAVRRYTGHVVSCLGFGTHSLAPLSFLGASYSGVFTLLPLVTGLGQANHGDILRQAAALVDGGKLKPLVNSQSFSCETLAEAFDCVSSGAEGKVVVDMP
jgi:NADPH2:quinone reductase